MLAALSTASLAIADDVLYSKRHLSKRFIDDNGNYNMSEFGLNPQVRF